MAGKQAKPLTPKDLRKVMALVRRHRYPKRDRVMVLLSVKAGLRAGEIAGLTWAMILNPSGKVGNAVAIEDAIAKRGRGRTVPLNPELRTALVRLRGKALGPGPVICSERGTRMRASSVVNWFAALYRKADLNGCSSHSGRRTFITAAAKLIPRIGGSLRDVQELAGHASIEMTQRYIVGDTQAKRRLVRLL